MRGGAGTDATRAFFKTKPRAPAGRAGGARGFIADNVLVLIHAFPMNADMWEAQLAAAPAGWRHLAPDLRGFGQSEAGESGDPHSLALDDYANDVLALLDQLAIERAVVAGLSTRGSPTAARFVNQNDFQVSYGTFDWRLNDLAVRR